MENTPEPARSHNPFEKIPRRTQLLLVGAVILIALGAAYFIGSDAYYRVHPLEKIEVGTPYGSEDDAAGYKKMLDLFAAAPSISCLTYENGYAPRDTENALFAAFADAPATCAKIRTLGKGAIEHIVYLSPYSYGGEAGLGSAVVGDDTYLVYFSVGGSWEAGEKDKVYISRIALLKDAHGPAALSIIQSSTNTKIVKITGEDGTRALFERFLLSHGDRYGQSLGAPLRQNPDGSFSQEVMTAATTDRYGIEYPATASFSLPLLGNVNLGWGDRDPNLEAAAGIKPLYHQQSCGVEETYADMSVYEYPEGASDGTMKILIQPGVYPSLNITSKTSGYAPEDWGKVLARITPEEFRHLASAPGTRNPSIPSDMLTIEGRQVKFVGPYGGDAWCNGNSYPVTYFYQAVIGNAVVSFEFYNPNASSGSVVRDGAPSKPWEASEREKVVAEVLRTLTITPN